MRVTYSIRRIGLLCYLLLIPLLTSCDVLPTISLGPDAQTPTAANAGWTQAAPGVELRSETWNSPSMKGISDIVKIVRFDPRAITLSVAYQPEQPLSMQGWMQKEHATALINGGYFDGQDTATALVISNGQSFGTSYAGFGGMLAVDGKGHVQLRSLRDQAYSNSEVLTQATQSAPMLLVNGQRTQFNADPKASPRSVVAIDRHGRLLFLASPGASFTLDDLATLLAKSDLGLVNALNLDGGSSTGLYVNAGDQSVSIDAYVNLPLVIVVKAK